MEKAIKVIISAQSDGLFSSYAIGGGIAALFYIEPVATFDLDIFIILESPGQIISLAPIYSWLEKRGYKPSKEQVIIEGIAVQFIPVYNDLIKEGVLNAVDKKYGETSASVLRQEYLVAIMLQTGRPKDKDRILKFLQETDLDYAILNPVLQKHNLMQVFEQFKRQYYGSQT